MSSPQLQLRHLLVYEIILNMWNVLDPNNLGTTSSWVAATVSLTSAVLSIWIPWRNRPQASFTPIEHVLKEGDVMLIPARGEHPDQQITAATHRMFNIVNSGDGDGYSVSIAFLNCTGRTAMKCSDGTYSLAISGGSFSTKDNLWVFVDKRSMCSSSSLEVHWITPPTRLHHCQYQRLHIPASATVWARSGRLVLALARMGHHRSWHWRNRLGHLHF